MEKISKDTQPIEIYQTIEPDQVQEPEVSDLTRKEILEYIEEFAGELTNKNNTFTDKEIFTIRRAIAELLHSLGLDYSNPEYFVELRKIQNEQKMVDKLADIVADRLGDSADKTDLLNITAIRNMTIDQAIYTASITLIRNGRPAIKISQLNN
jgi:hypothetical protein